MGSTSSNANPESLHNVAQGTNNKISNDNFVSPGTPTAPLAGQKDLINPVMSEKGSMSLRDNLIKG